LSNWCTGRSAAAKLAVVGEAEAAAAEALLKRMSAAKVNSIFTHLRKLAQHPLLVRASYTDAKVAELARLAHQKCVSNLVAPLHTTRSLLQALLVPAEQQLTTRSTISPPYAAFLAEA
jgi:SWI/SNF-related matrix-associated actin-dependent regulator 1 of chromatin subfamily A